MRLHSPPRIPGASGPLKGIADYLAEIYRASQRPDSNYLRIIGIGSKTYDPASLADGDGATTTITVAGARLDATTPDFVLVSFSLALQGVLLTGWVSDVDEVSARFENHTGGVVDLDSGTLSAVVVRRQ